VTGTRPWHVHRCFLAVSVCAALLVACGVEPTRPAKTRPFALATTAAPTTTRTTRPTTTVPLICYQASRGDTLTAIARRFGVSVAAIAAANHISNPDQAH